MRISRVKLLRAAVLSVPAAVLSACGVGNYDDSTPFYVKQNDEEIGIAAAYQRDFPSGAKVDGIDQLLGQLIKDKETLTLKALDRGRVYAGQITRPLNYVEVSSGFGRAKHVEETAHPIEISTLEIVPTPKYGYFGNLSFHDRAGDLRDFLVAIDGNIYKEGVFIKAGSLGVLGEFIARTEMTVVLVGNSPLEAKIDKMPLGCLGDDKGNLFSSSGGGVRFFGNIPTGKHELMFYAMDKRGNRSFTMTRYEI